MVTISPTPLEGDRRAPLDERTDDSVIRRARLVERALATTLDTIASLSVTTAISLLMDINFWTVAGVVTIMYYTGMTIAFGASPGLRLVKMLRERLPSPAAVANRSRAHA